MGFLQGIRVDKNMRLQGTNLDKELHQNKDFSDWILKVGDGFFGENNDGEAVLEIPQDILIQYTDDPFSSLVDFTYPSIQQNLQDSHYFKK